jgi:hypothetical protein
MRLTKEGKKKRDEAFGEDSFLTNRLLQILDIPAGDLEHLLQTHKGLIEKLRERDGVEHGEDTVSTGAN